MICTDKSRVIEIWFCKFVLCSYFLLICVPLYPRESILTCSFWCSTNFFHELSFAVLISAADIATRCNAQIQPNREISQSRSHPWKTCACSLDKQTCRRLMHWQTKLGSLASLYLSFDVNHFEIKELSFLTLWWDFRKEASFWHRFRLLILTRLAGLIRCLKGGPEFRISKICASWMSLWNISANYVLQDHTRCRCALGT